MLQLLDPPAHALCDTAAPQVPARSAAVSGCSALPAQAAPTHPPGPAACRPPFPPTNPPSLYLDVRTMMCATMCASMHTAVRPHAHPMHLLDSILPTCVIDSITQAGTFNVAGRKPEPHSLRPWVNLWEGQWPSVSATPPDPQGARQGGGSGRSTGTGEGAASRTSAGDEALGGTGGSVAEALARSPEIVALGFQEVVALSAGNVVVGR